jgi:hypothetical protein
MTPQRMERLGAMMAVAIFVLSGHRRCGVVAALTQPTIFSGLPNLLTGFVKSLTATGHGPRRLSGCGRA